MNPTDLPDLSRPNFSGSNRRKTSKLGISISIKIRKTCLDLMCSSLAGFVRIPRSEPIQLDLEPLFLLSVSKENFYFKRTKRTWVGFGTQEGAIMEPKSWRENVQKGIWKTQIADDNKSKISWGIVEEIMEICFSDESQSKSAPYSNRFANAFHAITCMLAFCTAGQNRNPGAKAQQVGFSSAVRVGGAR